MKRWRLSIFPGITYSGVSCSCIGRLVPGVSQPLFLLSPLMYQRLGQLATSGKRLQQLCDIYIYIIYTLSAIFNLQQHTTQLLLLCFVGRRCALPPIRRLRPPPNPASRLFHLNPSLHICKYITPQIYFSKAHSRVPIHMLTYTQP